MPVTSVASFLPYPSLRFEHLFQFFITSILRPEFSVLPSDCLARNCVDKIFHPHLVNDGTDANFRLKHKNLTAYGQWNGFLHSSVDDQLYLKTLFLQQEARI
ncbi:hypothetical protein T4B_7805 [Trichinella pseudospiralis]|uniref:Uncharacterized protein n=2 Tax=Trichinella pseudospiralis TaxID=6337 RepID=A0A0V1IBS9_TRIPS|nr:hypothetical protein T4E_4142 [Trichinella pseudospiralis]KRY74094.1 hypothetical protein T4A_1388 [Trichinella pseudospiralis]KRY81952.1 hypothetical protein T4D_2683 [Trichinella pseudospiralis]KRZ20273.1 hypothetical protein T4B_7805 [Trichinella pseudospiralis]